MEKNMEPHEESSEHCAPYKYLVEAANALRMFETEAYLQGEFALYHQKTYAYPDLQATCLACGKRFRPDVQLRFGSCPRVPEEEQRDFMPVYCNVSAVCGETRREFGINVHPEILIAEEI